jgi:predicted nucleic acid-binding protein
VRVVLDSSVLVAALRSRRGASFRLLQLLRAGRFQVAVSVPLVLQYEAVLLRHAGQLGLKPEEAVGIVDYLCRTAHRQQVYFLWRPALSDPEDEFILELAVAAHCAAIVTHNIRHFKEAGRFGVKVRTPGEFLLMVEEKA